MSSPAEVYAQMCLEAAQACGPDLEAIQAFVDRRLAAMSEADREAIEAEIKRVTDHRAPGFHEHGPH